VSASDHPPLLKKTVDILTPDLCYYKISTEPAKLNWSRLKNAGERRFYVEDVHKSISNYNWCICTKSGCNDALHKVEINWIADQINLTNADIGTSQTWSLNTWQLYMKSDTY